MQGPLNRFFCPTPFEDTRPFKTNCKMKNRRFEKSTAKADCRLLPHTLQARPLRLRGTPEIHPLPVLNAPEFPAATPAATRCGGHSVGTRLATRSCKSAPHRNPGLSGSVLESTPLRASLAGSALRLQSPRTTSAQGSNETLQGVNTSSCGCVCVCVCVNTSLALTHSLNAGQSQHSSQFLRTDNRRASGEVADILHQRRPTGWRTKRARLGLAALRRGRMPFRTR